MKIGDIVWRFDQNRRVYPPKKPGAQYSFGGPIYREHWAPVTIIGETRISWLCGFGLGRGCHWKAPKKGLRPGWCFSLKELDDACWVNDYRIEIVDALRQVSDADILRKIADLIGWTPTTAPRS